MKFVTLTGGNGGYTLLSGLKKYDVDITAIIGCFDSGGSTGKLRREYGGIALGDLRRGYLALGSEEEPYGIMKELLKKRFEKDTSLNGHSLGNLILLGLGVNKNPDTLEKARKIFGFKENYKVLPPSFDDCHLCAELEDGTIIEGETNIDVPKHDTSLKISRVFLKPEATAYEEAVEEIKSADAIIIGPGDLYTSVMQNLLVKGIPEAIRESEATKIYVSNIMTKKGETENFKVSDFVKEIEKYMSCAPDYVIVNNKKVEKKNVEELHLDFVECDKEELEKLGVKVVLADVVNEEKPDVHDSDKLASIIMEVAECRR